MKKGYYILAAALLLAAIAAGLALPEAAVRMQDSRLASGVRYAQGENLGMDGMEALTIAEKLRIAGAAGRIYQMNVTEGTATDQEEAIRLGREVCAALQEDGSPAPAETTASACLETYTDGSSLLLWQVDMNWDDGTVLSLSLDDETGAVLRLLLYMGVDTEPFSGFWTWDGEDEQARFTQLEALLGRALRRTAAGCELSIQPGETVGTLRLRQEDGTVTDVSAWADLKTGMLNFNNQ